MGYNLKALHYCGTHKYIFLKKNCKNCGQGMCGECIDNHEHFCPECVVQLNMQTSGYKAKKKVAYATLLGILTLSLYLGYHYFLKTEGTTLNVGWYLLIAFCLGVSAMVTYYLLNKSQDFHDVGRLPFIGFKLYFITPIVLTLSFIPVLFYLYWLFLVILNLFKANKIN